MFVWRVLIYVDTLRWAQSQSSDIQLCDSLETEDVFLILQFGAVEVRFPLLDVNPVTSDGLVEARVKGVKVAYFLTPEIDLPVQFFEQAEIKIELIDNKSSLAMQDQAVHPFRLFNKQRDPQRHIKQIQLYSARDYHRIVVNTCIGLELCRYEEINAHLKRQEGEEEENIDLEFIQKLKISTDTLRLESYWGVYHPAQLITPDPLPWDWVNYIEETRLMANTTIFSEIRVKGDEEEEKASQISQRQLSRLTEVREEIQEMELVHRSQSCKQLYGVPGEVQKPPIPEKKRRAFPDLRSREVSPFLIKMSRFKRRSESNPILAYLDERARERNPSPMMSALKSRNRMYSIPDGKVGRVRERGIPSHLSQRSYRNSGEITRPSTFRVESKKRSNSGSGWSRSPSQDSSLKYPLQQQLTGVTREYERIVKQEKKKERREQLVKMKGMRRENQLGDFKKSFLRKVERSFRRGCP